LHRLHVGEERQRRVGVVVHPLFERLAEQPRLDERVEQREVFQLGGGGVERRVGVLLHVLADLLGVLGALGRPLRERLGAAGRVRDDRGQRLRRGGVFDGPVFVGRGGERRTHQREI